MSIYLARVARYFKAVKKFYLSENKGRFVPLEVLEARYDKCSKCTQFNGIVCNICGCCGGSKISHFNKLAFPTERCPKDPPEWVEHEHTRS